MSIADVTGYCSMFPSRSSLTLTFSSAPAAHVVQCDGSMAALRLAILNTRKTAQEFKAFQVGGIIGELLVRPQLVFIQAASNG